MKKDAKIMMWIFVFAATDDLKLVQEKPSREFYEKIRGKVFLFQKSYGLNMESC